MKKWEYIVFYSGTNENLARKITDFLNKYPEDCRKLVGGICVAGNGLRYQSAMYVSVQTVK